MVYFILDIILGVAVTREEIETICDVDDSGFVEDSVLDTLLCRKDVEVCQFSCCSKSNGKLYLIGIRMHRYYRKSTRCENCPNYCVCDTCIGQTNNGHYDVEAILDGPTEANLRHVCLHCFADNREDLGAPKEDSSAVGPQGMPCKTCGLKPDDRFTPTKKLTRLHYHEQLKALFKKYEVTKNKEIKFYYMVDDCLSCT